MTLNKREQRMAITVGAVVGVAVLFLLVKILFLDQLEDRNSRIELTKKKIMDSKNLIATAKKDDEAWPKLGILRADEQAEMAAQVQGLVQNSVSRRRVSLPNQTLTPVSRAISKTDYEQLTISLKATGNMGGIWQFLYALEDSGQPIRVDSIGISAPKAGEDNLNVDVKLSALMYKEPPVKGARPGATTAIARNTAGRGGRAGTTTRAGAATTTATPGGAEDLATIEARMMAKRAQENKHIETGATTATAPATMPAAVPATSPATATRGAL